MEHPYQTISMMLLHLLIDCSKQRNYSFQLGSLGAIVLIHSCTSSNIFVSHKHEYFYKITLYNISSFCYILVYGRCYALFAFLWVLFIVCFSCELFSPFIIIKIKFKGLRSCPRFFLLISKNFQNQYFWRQCFLFYWPYDVHCVSEWDMKSLTQWGEGGWVQKSSICNHNHPNVFCGMRA